MIVLLGLNVYSIIYAGIYSKNKYAYLGGIRSGAARVSYEVIFSLNILLFMFYLKSYMIEKIFNLGLMLIFFSFLIRVLVEIRRTPFDYSESERELVSGFNIEYGRVGFVLFFLKEYGRLIFFSIVMSTLFFRGSFFVTTLIFVLVVLIRSSYPRVRFDKLMGVFWLQLVFFVSSALWASRSQPRFTFEPGESHLPLQAKVTNVTMGEGVTNKLVTLRLLEGEPDHLRVLGQKVTVTSPDKDVSFIVGPDVKKAHTYSVVAGGDPPQLTVVGGDDRTFALIYKGSCLFKNA